MGARTYASLDATTATQIGESNDVWAYFWVPDLAIFYDYGDAEEAFKDIFKVDDSEDYIDLLGMAEGYGGIETQNADGTFNYQDAFSMVEVGFKVGNETEPTYFGIQFTAELPTDKLVLDSQIINWAKYTFLDQDGNEDPEMSQAVACIITLGDKSATEVRTYDNMIDIESMDDAELENHRIYDGPWAV